MQSSENDLVEAQQAEPAPAIAPAWHTIVLVAAIVALSVHGAAHFAVARGSLDRLATYGSSAVMELLMLGWVMLGLRLKKTPLRALLGSCEWKPRAVAVDIVFALGFWLSSLMVLGTLGMIWSGAEMALTHRTPAAHVAGQRLATTPSEQQALDALKQLAPANGREILAWTLLCMLVGFVEEIVFRGYLQRQFIGWARGGVVAGVVTSALVFGGAHGYQGARNMFLIFVFGALFSSLALYRRGLRACIIAHGWHDLMAGLALSLLQSKHLI